jgi:hypothetical protein
VNSQARRPGERLRIVIDAYLVHYPLGGILSWILQFLVGFQRLGHDVYWVEKSPYRSSCYDPDTDEMTDDYRPALARIRALLRRFGLDDRWCYVSSDGSYHGLARTSMMEILGSADLFVELATHGHWLEDAHGVGLRVLVDGEPGFSQMVMERARAAGNQLPEYDLYFTPGLNIGTPRSVAPSAGRDWRPLGTPVLTDLITPIEGDSSGAAFTTVMNWQAHRPYEFDGVTYGQKAVEFERFVDLPRRTRAKLEVAVSGKDVPFARLERSGWHVRAANRITRSVDAYWNYIRSSRGEFSVAKNVFVATNSGWFSERSALYLASGRPVVLQDTGFSEHIPCGRGLFAVRNVYEAAEALEEVERDHDRHARWARELAAAHFEARSVLGRFLKDVGF